MGAFSGLDPNPCGEQPRKTETPGILVGSAFENLQTLNWTKTLDKACWGCGSKILARLDAVNKGQDPPLNKQSCWVFFAGLDWQGPSYLGWMRWTSWRYGWLACNLGGRHESDEKVTIGGGKKQGDLLLWFVELVFFPFFFLHDLLGHGYNNYESSEWNLVIGFTTMKILSIEVGFGSIRFLRN